jgi:hypothetical protein
MTLLYLLLFAGAVSLRSAATEWARLELQAGLARVLPAGAQHPKGDQKAHPSARVCAAASWRIGQPGLGAACVPAGMMGSDLSEEGPRGAVGVLLPGDADGIAAR